MSPSVVEPVAYSIEDLPGKGKGLIANRLIKAGELLIAEDPLFTTETLTNADTVEQDLGKIIKKLSKEDQRAFLSLHNNFKGQGNAFSNIIRSNGYPLGPASNVGAIFVLVSRMNHSCRPNCQHAWHDREQQMFVHATRDISAGEEITTSYLVGGPPSQRQAILKEQFRFDCACELCNLPPKEKAQSDARLSRAAELDEAIGNPKRVRYSPELALKDSRALLKIYEEERICDLRLSRLYYDAFQICAMHSDKARASVFVQRSAETRHICEGESEESENLRGFAKDPASYEHFGVTTKWKSSIEDIPDKLDQEEFHAWLWRES